MYSTFKKIEKNIRYSKELDTYYVEFVFSSRLNSKLRSFSTLEEARRYRDAINEEKTLLKIKEDRMKIRESEKKELIENKLKDVYPQNLLEALKIDEKDINFIFLDEATLEMLMHTSLLEKEESCLLHFYKNLYTLEEISKIQNITKEGVRQRILRATWKLKNKILRYDIEKERLNELNLAQQEMEKLAEQREKLIEAFKEKGIITEDIVAYFGKPSFITKASDKQYNTESNEKLDELSIETLDLTSRSYNALRRKGIRTIKDLTKYTVRDLGFFRNLGVASVREITDKLLKVYNIKLQSGDDGESGYW